MWEKLRLKKSEALMQKGEEAFQRGEIGLAFDLCSQMIDRGYSGGWELKAMICASQGDPDEAYESLMEHFHLLRATSDQSGRRRAEVLHIRLLVRAGLFSHLNEFLQKPWEIGMDEALGTAADECVKLGSRAEGRDFAVRLAHLDHDAHGAFWYIRESDNIYSEETMMYRFVVGGPFEGTGAYTAVQYHVAASSPEDAFKFDMEVEPSIPDMKLVEMVDEKPSPNLPHGVYWRSPWISGPN